jgi:LPXTG-site transpeptidase (sortase) family protein
LFIVVILLKSFYDKDMKFITFFAQALFILLFIFNVQVHSAFAAPTIQISKIIATSTPNPIPSGTAFDYVMTWRCIGAVSPTDDCINMKIVDVLPPYLEFVSASPVAPVSTITGTSTININFQPVVPAGGVGTVNMRVRFAPGFTPNNTVAINTASIVADGVATSSGSAPAITASAVDRTTVTKVLLANNAVDNTARYELQVCDNANTVSGVVLGSLVMTNVTVTENIPAGGVFVSSNITPTAVTPTTVTWTFPTLQGQYGCTNITANIKYPISNPVNTIGASKTNTVSVAYTPAGGVSTTKNSSVTHLLQTPAPSFGFTKGLSPTRLVGDTNGMSFTISNTGNTDMRAELVDFIPGELKITGSDYLFGAGADVFQFQKNNINSWITGSSTSVNTQLNSTILPGFTFGTDILTAIKLVFNSIFPGVQIIPSLTATVANPAQGTTTPYTFPHTIVNTASLDVSTNGATSTLASSATTTVLNPVLKFAPAPIKGFDGQASPYSVAPGQVIRYALQMNFPNYVLTYSEFSPVLNPTFVDLLPLGFTLSTTTLSNVASINVTGGAVGNNNCAPAVRSYPNYNNSGRELVEFTWQGKTPQCSFDYNSFYLLSFDVKIAPGTPVGNYPNQLVYVNSESNPSDTLLTSTSAPANGFCVLGANLDEAILTSSSSSPSINTGKMCSGNGVGPIAAVGSFFQITSRKGVKGQLDSGFLYSGSSNVARTVRGGTMLWSTEITNEGNVGASNLDIVDILPFPGNTGVGNPVSLGSTWTPKLLGPVLPVGAASTTKVYYSTEGNPCRNTIVSAPGCTVMTTITGTPPGPAQWSDVIPSDPTTVRSLRFNFGSALLVGGQTIRFEYVMGAPSTAPISTNGSDGTPATSDDSDVAWNSFGYSLTRNDTSATETAAPTRVGIIVQAALAGTYSLGDYVWHDANQDGIQNEPVANGINGVLVKLYSDTDGNILTTGDQTFIASNFTGNDTFSNPGYYLFPSLSPGNYFVEFTKPVAYPIVSPTGAGTSATDSNGTLVPSTTIVRTGIVPIVSSDVLTVDQGFHTGTVLGASLGNFVWVDTNRDGNQTGETGINGVLVELLNSSSAVIATTTTSSTVDALAGNSSGLPGYYHFKNITPGTYSVRFTPPGGYLFTSKDVATTTDLLDSDADTTTGRTGSYTLIAGDNNLTVDAGIYTPTPTADLEVTKTDSKATYVASTTNTYVVTIKNWGPSNVLSGVLNDAIPLGITGFSWTCSVLATDGDCDTVAPGVQTTATGTGALSNRTFDLQVGKSMIYTIVASVSSLATAPITNTATVTLPGTLVQDATDRPNSAADVDTLYSAPVVPSIPVSSGARGGGSSFRASLPAPVESFIAGISSSRLLQLTGVTATKKAVKKVKSKISSVIPVSVPPKPIVKGDTYYMTDAVGRSLGASAVSTKDTISIPSIGSVEPIYNVSTVKELHSGTWMLPWTSTPEKGSNTVVVGHSYSDKYGYNKGPWFDLKNVKKGDTIEVTKNGKKYTYTVYESGSVTPEHIEIEGSSSDAILTLYTCGPDFSSAVRVYVRAKLNS